LDKENTALTNATRATPPTAVDSSLCADSELDASMIVDKMQHLKSRLKLASDKLDKPVDICGNVSVTCFVFSVLRLFHFCESKPASGYASQRILSQSPSPELGRVVAEGESNIKILWSAWLGLLSLSSVWLLQPASGHTMRGDQRLTKGFVKSRIRQI